MFINHPNLNDLLISMINIKVFCPQFHDVVIVDTTCLLTLKQIYQECMDDHSERG